MPPKRSAARRRGNATIEFTLVGIPLIFVLVSTFEMARGMWNYHTLAYTAKEGTRWAIVHGADCYSGSSVCNHTYTRNDIATVIQSAGIGLDPALLNVTLTVNGVTTTNCNPLNSCIGDATAWPGVTATPSTDIVISATYPFRSAIAMFWPGVGKAQAFGVFTLPAYSRDRVMF